MLLHKMTPLVTRETELAEASQTVMVVEKCLKNVEKYLPIKLNAVLRIGQLIFMIYLRC